MVKIVAADRRIEDLVDTGEEFRLLGSGFVFTEGPVWDKTTRTLLFNDIRADSGYRWTEAEGVTLARRPNHITNGMVFDRTGGLLACEHVTSQVVRIRRDGSRELVAYHYEGRYLNSPNDIITRSDGLIYFTDPDYGRWDHAVGVARKRDLDFYGLFRVRPGGQVELAAPPDTFDQPNGLCFSPDESELYVNDRTGAFAFTVAPDGALSGTPASAGTVTGPARVILDPVGAHLEPGEILVAPSTDPGWTPLFLTAGGLVMEMGGANSHGAVVAREYGIPAVICVRDATKVISTGQVITVDGAAGTVVVEEGSSG